MIKAIIEGRKTVTRRLDNLKATNSKPDNWTLIPGRVIYPPYSCMFESPEERILVRPRYLPGETVYIKEAHWYPPNHEQNRNLVSYRLIVSDNCGEEAAQTSIWKSPLFMPAWAARYFLQILDVRPERLQDITWEDTHKEGILRFDGEHPDPINGGIGYNRGATGLPMRYESVAAYMDLWDSINPKHLWSSNPWVLRYEYQTVKK